LKVGFREKKVSFAVGQDGNIRTMESELTYYTEVVKPQMILVPIGFKTDLGSIPQILQGMIPKDGKALFGYILHDYLYKIGLFTRDECDDMLREAMKALDVVWWRVQSVRGGLAVGGWYAWNKHREGLKCTK